MACDIIAIRFFINHSMKKEISQKIKINLFKLKKNQVSSVFQIQMGGYLFIGRCLIL